ncbi:hypothetical protein [Winogradskyella flava]|uniref:Uncharacterized protein n=1 Tax=Winogradskyella flava TaxID=1884876 RepID=A0A842IP78_9FLAO|nr:hypothetical protein [Winogradskyella flava]MBC2845032.1 hypothetical protein [Winogradskyella flava]
MIKSIPLATVVLVFFVANKQPDNEKCLTLRNSTLFYGKTKNNQIIISGNNHTEFIGSYFIKSKLEWVNDCEYNRTIISIRTTTTYRKKRTKRPVRINEEDYMPRKLRNIRSGPSRFNVGDVLNVKINDIIDNEVFYTATRGNKSWDGEMTLKQKKKGKKKKKKSQS